ncbi:hypothetical protein P3T76_010201 [Phytophthora citrophthora]|uniref:MULE transposase domain-containing protein n=1 Tax=Phytophthora citrophthora TaxID=4793 RepID=A0AAD9GEI5_9STRA|nr:hypothetical protein P3T76_010201 [Phytophthora citrophthora]
MTQGAIWTAIFEKFYTNTTEGPVRGAGKQAVLKRVQNSRAKLSGGDTSHSIEIPPRSKVVGSCQGFFQFQYSWHDDTKTQKDGVGVDRIVAWAHPVLRSLLRFEGLSWYIDGTFRCTPKGYKQCVTIMIYDPSSRLFIPTVFALTTSSTKPAYRRLLQCTQEMVGSPLSPKDAVCDFENSLIMAIREFFPTIRIIGCLFHFKQACRRKMKEYRLPDAETKLAMKASVFDVLTVVDPSKVAVEGIAWVKTEIRTRCSQKGINYSRKKWTKFWKYFKRTWLVMYPPTYWNVYGISRAIVSRTNNPLERFHRVLNTRFPPHPSMNRFISTIEALAREYVCQREAIMAGLADPPKRRGFKLPRAPRLPNRSDIIASESSSSNDDSIDPCESCIGDFSWNSSTNEEEKEDSRPDYSFDYDHETQAVI